MTGVPDTDIKVRTGKLRTRLMVSSQRMPRSRVNTRYWKEAWDGPPRTGRRNQSLSLHLTVRV